jgi:hypothetical protein
VHRSTLTVGLTAFHPIAVIPGAGQTTLMGKRSGFPHRDDELAALTNEELQSELERSRARLSIAPSAKMAKLWHKRIHWLESTLATRTE